MKTAYQNYDTGFVPLPDAILSAIRRQCPRRQFDAGQMIMQHGEDCHGFWVIDTGQVATGRFRENGQFTMLGLHDQAQLLGDLAFHAGLPRQVDAIAWTNASLTWVDRRNWLQLLRDVEGLAVLMMQSQAVQLANAIERLASLQRESANVRLARALLAHADAAGELHLTQVQLAELIEVTRITAGKGLRLLEAEGLISRRYGLIRIADADRLSNWIEQARLADHNGD